MEVFCLTKWYRKTADSPKAWKHQSTDWQQQLQWKVTTAKQIKSVLPGRVKLWNNHNQLTECKYIVEYHQQEHGRVLTGTVTSVKSKQSKAKWKCLQDNHNRLTISMRALVDTVTLKGWVLARVAKCSHFTNKLGSLKRKAKGQIRCTISKHRNGIYAILWGYIEILLIWQFENANDWMIIFLRKHFCF